jgi:hypothetical protein
MSITLSALQQQRRDTAANWTTANPTLLNGELGYETDTGKWKIGDGSTAWTALGYTPWSQLSYPIVNADVSATAEIAVSKLANGTANQVLVTDGTDVSWSDDLTIAGNLTVNGTTTTVNSTTLTVDDKNIELGSVATPTDSTANGGGITLKAATDKTINWYSSTDAWTFSQDINLNESKVYKIQNQTVLSATTLGSNVVNSSLTAVGTLATGTWNATTIGTAYGGTGQTTYTDGQLLIGNSTGNTLDKATLTAGSNVTITNGGGSIEIASANTEYTAGDGLDLTGTEFSADLKANGGLVIQSTELAVDLGASSITGTLGIADGGTGQTASFSDGELLIGKTDGTLAKATLTAGSGATITNADGAITIAAAGTGLPTGGGTLTGDLTLSNQADLRFGEATANGSNFVAFQAPATIASDITWTLPSADAAISGYALVSDAAGTLSWSKAGGGATGGGTDAIFHENGNTVTTSYTIGTTLGDTANCNAMSAGPVSVNSGVVVTIESGSSWVVI